MCYMDTDSLIVYIKADDIYLLMFIYWYASSEDVETRVDTLNYELDRPLPKGKNKKAIVLLEEQAQKSWKTKKSQ